jgi:hypothetical protein
MRLTAALFFAALALAPVPARAAILTYEIAGTITELLNMQSLEVGQSFTATFSYDAAVPDTDPDPLLGVYSQIVSIAFDFNSGTLSGTAAAETLLVHLSDWDLGGAHVWWLGSETEPGVFMLFADRRREVFTTDALGPIPPLSDFTDAQFLVVVDVGRDPVAVLGSINSLTLRQVPEPLSLMLVAPALSGSPWRAGARRPDRRHPRRRCGPSV